MSSNAQVGKPAQEPEDARLLNLLTHHDIGETIAAGGIVYYFPTLAAQSEAVRALALCGAALAGLRGRQPLPMGDAALALELLPRLQAVLSADAVQMPAALVRDAHFGPSPPPPPAQQPQQQLSRP